MAAVITARHLHAFNVTKKEITAYLLESFLYKSGLVGNNSERFYFEDAMKEIALIEKCETKIDYLFADRKGLKVPLNRKLRSSVYEAYCRAKSHTGPTYDAYKAAREEYKQMQAKAHDDMVGNAALSAILTMQENRMAY